MDWTLPNPNTVQIFFELDNLRPSQDPNMFLSLVHYCQNLGQQDYECFRKAGGEPAVKHDPSSMTP